MDILIPARLPWILEALLVALAIPAAVFDIRYRKIPNWLCVTGFAAGLGTRLWIGGWGWLMDGLAGFAVAFGVYFGMYLLHAMGAGDVKLMGAVGAAAGLRSWLLVFIASSIVGMIAGLVLAARKGRLGATIWNVGYLVRELLSFRAPWLTHQQLDVKNPETLRLPHGASILAGVSLSLALTWWRRG